MGDTINLKYVDTKELWFPRLEKYKSGVQINYGDMIEVTEGEAEHLLKKKNGSNLVFEEVKSRRKDKEEKNGSW